MQLKKDAEATMRQWLSDCCRDTHTLGLVSEAGGTFAGFLIGRVNDWESVPPVIKARRIGIIDALYVVEAYRRQGIASQLIDRATQLMREDNAIAIETIYDAWSEPSINAWRRAGFMPWMVHAYRML